jgi:hypothetical protein
MLDKEIIKQQREAYNRRGYANRSEYLQGLANEYGVGIDVVLSLAMTLGPIEDFDGLVSMLEDAAMYL